MTNAHCILAYLPLLLINSILLIDAARKDKTKMLVRFTILFNASILGWELLEMWYYVSRNSIVLQYIFDLKLMFVSAVVVTIFGMFLVFYRLDRAVPKWLMPLICLVPAITSALALTSPLHPLLVRSFEVITLSPLTVSLKTRGVWFFVHSAYCQAVMVIIALSILLKNKKLPAGYRSGTLFMLLGIGLYLLGTLVELLGLDGGNPVDYNMVGASIGSFFFYFAMIINGRTDYLQIERREIFNYLDESVFILDADGLIINANRSAHNLLIFLGQEFQHIPFRQLVDTLTSQGKIVVKPAEEGEDNYVYITKAQQLMIFRVHRQPLETRDGERPGIFVILTDVTKNRLFIERLQEMAGSDSLTGLPNRYRYQELLRLLDRPENLPLSIVIGDVNGLKVMNDTYGHDMGDHLLRVMAGLLQKCCPSSGYVARIGGDEFAMLLPKATPDDTASILLAVRTGLAELDGLPTRPSIALGSATKIAPQENLSTLISVADANMYLDKR